MKKLLISFNGKSYEVDVEVLADDEASLQTNMPFMSSMPPVHTERHDSVSMAEPPHQHQQKPRSSSSSGNALISTVNGVLLEIHAQPGKLIKEGELAFAIEAMKMKTNIYSSRTATVKEVKVKLNDSIEVGAELLIYE